MIINLLKLSILISLLLSCSDDNFVADCGTWGEHSECRELDAPELAVWDELTECMEIPEPLPPPTVIIVKSITIECGDVISSGCQASGFVVFPTGKSDILEDPVIWRHEFTHEILDLINGKPDRKHKGEWFVTGRCIN